jgi:prepilin-type N-terminal cleavage/methylation domain-containing protein
MNSTPVITPKRRCSDCGFTLIELLAVIAIIGVLAGILIAIVANVRERARNSQCVANLRSLQQGILLCATDNKGKIPLEQPGTPEAGYNPWNWHRRISPYVGGPSAVEWNNPKPVPPVYRCPSDEAPFVGIISYGMNWNLLNGRVNAMGNNPVCLADCTNVEIQTPNDSTINYLTADHHKGAGNYSRMDGSVHSFVKTLPTRGERPDLWKLNN